MRTRKIITVLAVASIIVACSSSDPSPLQNSGESLATLSFHSSILQKEINYSIFLPPHYAGNEMKYPIIYALHSFGANRNEYIDGIQMHALVDSLINASVIPPCLIVTPDAGISWYINDYQDSIRYGEMFIQEFIPWVESHYRTLETRQGRSIMGFSMGGSGALNFALKRSDLFGSVGAFCAGFSTKAQIIADRDEDYKTYHQELYGVALLGEQRVNQHFLDNNPLYLVAASDQDILSSIQWYIASADDDDHSVGNAELHLALKKRNVSHEFRVSDGEHTHAFVNMMLPDYLNFLGPIFNGATFFNTP